MSTESCTFVTPDCPVSLTTYGYRPNLGANVFFCATFAILCALQLGLRLRYRTWTWLIATVLGTGMECAGYAGRLLMHQNPWKQSGFQLQIILLILAPSFLSASIDLTLKHIVIVFGSQYSHIRPSLYTWIFIGLDVVSILMQGIGGGMAGAAAASDTVNEGLLDAGNYLMLAGICVQVVQLVAFGIVTLDYIRRARSAQHGKGLSEEANRYLADWKFRGLSASIAVAYASILARCIYRIPEMAGGSGSALHREEVPFLILDGA